MNEPINSLSLVLEEPEISLYRLQSRCAPGLEIYCASTPPTRRILNRAEIAGVEFTRSLQEGVAAVLSRFPDQAERERMTDTSTGVINFLRSGLNFGLREALAGAWGFNSHLSSFITSQRERDRYGRWFIREDAYRKIELPAESTLFIGEIVATGVTMLNGLQIIGRMAKNLGKPVRNLVFFTVGCHKIEKALLDFDRLMRASFPGYHKTYLFYFEGKFHLADSKTEASIKLQGTDLMRKAALLTPEFEIEQFDPALTALERCVIYDGGARAFNPGLHRHELISYWRDMVALGEQGMSLEQALRERWPAPEYLLDFDSFAELKKPFWPGLAPSRLERIYQAGKSRREASFIAAAAKPGSLRPPARARLATLEKLP